MPYHFAYYCSGHGFGHATRVVATTHALLKQGHQVWIVTDARESIFTEAIADGARYRKAPIDAGISQPKAYSVDRSQTLAGLQAFLDSRPQRLQKEADWLARNNIDAVLSDAPFLPCAAAALAGIPAAIISNFTFDSCYSYLDIEPSHLDDTLDDEDHPLSLDILEPLVNQTIEDYKHASLLVRLPGAIPLPSFDLDVPLPSSSWVDRSRKRFKPEIESILSRPPSAVPASTPTAKRKVVDVPLIVRPINESAKTRQGRIAILDAAGVPADMHDCKILLVSFGGQYIPRPGSQQPTPEASPRLEAQDAAPSNRAAPTLNRIATEQHLYVPGAPPAHTHKLSTSPLSLSPLTINNGLLPRRRLIPNPGLLPPGWIALVCGLSENELKKDLPQGFYAARTRYIPDVCAVCDVLLGKLGYGTCSETIAAQLPFVYVPRPLFVEEYGLKRLTEQRNTLVEMDRTSFENGQWAEFVLDAWEQHQTRPTPADEPDAGPVIVGELEAWMVGQKELRSAV